MIQMFDLKVNRDEPIQSFTHGRRIECKILWERCVMLFEAMLWCSPPWSRGSHYPDVTVKHALYALRGWFLLPICDSVRLINKALTCFENGKCGFLFLWDEVTQCVKDWFMCDSPHSDTYYHPSLIPFTTLPNTNNPNIDSNYSHTPTTFNLN